MASTTASPEDGIDDALVTVANVEPTLHISQAEQTQHAVDRRKEKKKSFQNKHTHKKKRVTK